MRLKGTKFQIKVWNALKKIPKGKTKTYKEIAQIIGNPKAATAVGNACKANPRPIIIPCHRVIKSNGDLGGYSGSGALERKKKLIDFEKN